MEEDAFELSSEEKKIVKRTINLVTTGFGHNTGMHPVLSKIYTRTHWQEAGLCPHGFGAGEKHSPQEICSHWLVMTKELSSRYGSEIEAMQRIEIATVDILNSDLITEYGNSEKLMEKLAIHDQIVKGTKVKGSIERDIHRQKEGIKIRHEQVVQEEKLRKVIDASYKVVVEKNFKFGEDDKRDNNRTEGEAGEEVSSV